MKKLRRKLKRKISLKALTGALVISQALPLAGQLGGISVAQSAAAPGTQSGAAPGAQSAAAPGAQTATAPGAQTAAPGTPFADVPPGHWAVAEIESLKKQGIITGKTPTQFAPEDSVTRAEFATLLVRSLKLPLVTDKPQVFQDVKPDFYAYPYIQTAYHNGLLTGESATSFNPDGKITRQDMAAIIARALKVADVSDSFMLSSLNFVDNNQISGYAKKSVAAATYLELVKGYPDRSFKPVDPANRAAAAVMIDRLLKVPPSKIEQLKELANPIVKTIEVTPSAATLVIGETQPLSVTALDKNGHPVQNPPVTWSVSGDIGTLDGSVFTARKAGTGRITATVQQKGQAPITKSIEVTVEEPKHLSFSQPDYGTFKPMQPVAITVHVKDETGKPVVTDQNLKVTLIVNGPDGQSTLETTTYNGQANITLNKTKAGTYAVTVTGHRAVADGSASFQIVPGDFAKLKVYAAPSTFVRAGSSIEFISTAYDQWDNQLPPLPVKYQVSDQSFGRVTNASNPANGTFTAGSKKGTVTVTAQHGNVTVSKQLTVYKDATDLVSGKGDWMMWRDWKNYPVKETIQRLKDAQVTHVYLLVSTTIDGFFGQDSMDDFLHQAHDAGIAVMGWIYAANKDPYKDAEQTIQAMNYTTPAGQRFDGLAADLEENLYAWHQEEFAKSVRSALGDKYPMMAVIYPATWRDKQPWDVYKKYYDIMAPMVYWHYKAKPYTYKDAYGAVEAEMIKLREFTGKPIHMIGQSYNMFPNDWRQAPTWAEIQGAMKAAYDYKAVGYSTYRGRTATTEGWNEFAAFKWEN
ncbi:S-layer homology domain-containing protein [Effusibacillus lacus]|uniref:SLH domain-containing protein n=1 Tax=Effusibacillus lacus TaxID=1348429 RepID=A0A292YKF4_9BACL|nr:S-layer homology domain-containing protein [Effusibacillus lacus]TCS71786.1 Ig-like protein group 2 [Effusibacillus lacus]GAX89646.1 hypothetical protein EFBL_1270 [Effusibacillus lacus]